MNKEEFKELNKDQMIIAFNQLKDDYHNLFDELEQEKLKNKDVKSAVEYLKKIEPEKLKIIADSWNDKVAHKFDTEIKELTQKAFEDGQESIVKRYISKDKIKEIRDKAEVMDYYTLNNVIDDLTKVLGE